MDYLKLKGINDVTNQLLTDSIDEAILSFFDWGCLNAGGFVDVPVTSPGVNDPYADERLYSTHLEGVADNRVWEAVHSNWVYESGLNPPAPIISSGVYVNGGFHLSPGSGQYAHHMDYPEGRVVFDNPIPASSVVQSSYSYKWINFYDQDVPWFRDVIFDAYLIDDQPSGSGLIRLLNDQRVRLPAVISEPVMTRRQRGMMLGSGAQWVEQDILYHIIAERADQRNNIMDIITAQKDKNIFLYDVNARRRDHNFPLDWRGMIVRGAKMYPQLVDLPPAGYRWKQARFTRMVGQDITLKLPLFRAVIRTTVEVDFGEM